MILEMLNNEHLLSIFMENVVAMGRIVMQTYVNMTWTYIALVNDELWLELDAIMGTPVLSVFSTLTSCCMLTSTHVQYPVMVNSMSSTITIAPKVIHLLLSNTL